MIEAVIRICDEEIEIPGLAELLEGSWVHVSDLPETIKYERTFERGPNGKWRSICKPLVKNQLIHHISLKNDGLERRAL